MPADSIGSGHHTPRDGEVTDCSQHAARLENCRHRPYTEEIERTYGSQNHSTVAEFFSLLHCCKVLQEDEGFISFSV